MSNIEIFVNVDEKIKELETVEKVLRSAIKKENLDNISFNVIIVDNNYIHELNKNYRNIDRETDVITFALEDEDTIIIPDSERILGDIYISIDKAKEQANEYGHKLLRELCFLTIHGILHLLGYDHMKEEDEKVMFGLQERVLSEYGIERK